MKVTNINGTSDNTCKCDSWLAHWEKFNFSGQTLPASCPATSCINKPEVGSTIEDIYRYPLRQAAINTLNRQLRSGIVDEILAQLVIALREEDRLCIVHEEDEQREPQIICSLGLKGNNS